MPLPTLEWVNDRVEDDFQKDLITRKKLKELKQYNKLSINTKIRRLKNQLEQEIIFLQAKFMEDKHIIKQGGHPELGLEEDHITHLTDDAFDALVKGRKRRFKQKG